MRFCMILASQIVVGDACSAFSMGKYDATVSRWMSARSSSHSVLISYATATAEIAKTVTPN